MIKVGRNDLCPCGSGKKYKKCCYDKNNSIPPEVLLQLERMKAKQALIEKQQGLGRSIISTDFKGYRMVAVGNRMYYSQKWKTFHDFLFEYIRLIFGKEWGQTEFTKPFEERHPVVQWYETAHKYMKEHQGGIGTINTTPMTGAMAAYINLSYNLYLLAHNVEIQERMIKRLKDISQFRGAQYETYVAAEFIKAGFDLEIENEEDSRTTHCEFTAVSKKTCRKYSIEAKARQPGKETIGIGNQLYNALKKQAKHERIIFIDVNIVDLLNQIPNIMAEITQKESSLTINNSPAPSTYLFITNHPFEYDLEGICEHRTGFAHGFKIPDFSFDFKFTNIRDVLKARKNHQDMFDLVKSICEHEEIPSTFDGDIPEFAFNKELQEKRLLIGNKYLLSGKDGKDTIGILETATISSHEKLAYGSYLLQDGTRATYTCPVTEEEIEAYKKYPDTFFGVPRQQGRKVNDPVELYDFFYDSYKATPRERILEFVKNRPDFSALQKLSDEELLISYCEGLVYSAMAK